MTSILRLFPQRATVPRPVDERSSVFRFCPVLPRSRPGGRKYTFAPYPSKSGRARSVAASSLGPPKLGNLQGGRHLPNSGDHLLEILLKAIATVQYEAEVLNMSTELNLRSSHCMCGRVGTAPPRFMWFHRSYGSTQSYHTSIITIHDIYNSTACMHVSHLFFSLLAILGLMIVCLNT